MLALRTPHRILDQPSNRIFLLKFNIYFIASTQKLSHVALVKTLIAVEQFHDNFINFSQTDQKYREKVKFRCEDLLLLVPKCNVNGNRLGILEIEFRQCYFRMFHLFMQNASFSDKSLQCFLLLLQRFTIYLQKSDLAIQPISLRLKNLLRFLLTHLQFKLVQIFLLLQVPVKFNRLLHHLAEYRFLFQVANRTHYLFLCCPVDSQAIVVVAILTNCAFE